MPEREDAPTGRVARTDTESAPSGQVGLYIHIPFCERKCYYCDFNSGHYGTETRDRYVEALLRDIRSHSFGNRPAGSIFFGGGTPSVLPAPTLARILDALRDCFAVEDDAEVTVECNPGTLASERMAGETTADFLAGLRQAGVNRLSFGVQSFDAGLLHRLGRIHNPEQAVQSVYLARAAGFENINLDLMFALPGQSLDAWEDTLTQALALDVPHLSAYSLIVEPETPFAMWDAAGKLPRPSEDEEAAMYAMAMDLLVAAGYEHYEISAYARPRHRCRHNLVYWRNEEYIGFGVGATSYLNWERFSREPSLDRYIAQVLTGEDPVSERERLHIGGRMSETMMMTLRLSDGVNRRAFRERFGEDPLQVYGSEIRRLEAAGLLQVTDDAIALTRKGFFLANNVWEEFV